MKPIALTSIIFALMILEAGYFPPTSASARNAPAQTKQLSDPPISASSAAQPRASTLLTMHRFTGNLDEKDDSAQYSFTVPANADYVLVTLAMKEDRDFDLSLQDDQNRRTGGWISSESHNRYDIPSSNYSGWSNYGHRIREWITVKPTQTEGTWRVWCYSYSGNGTYTIRVEVRGGYLEEGTKEVGVEWINNYPGDYSDLQYSDDSAEGFRDKLADTGWTKSYTWSNSNVWERDYKSKLYTYYNTYNDETVTDSVDIAMYAGHGSKGTYTSDEDPDMEYEGGRLSLADDNHDDNKVAPHDAYMSWGDQDLEWIGFAACHELHTPWEWAQTMNGLHLICGFANRSIDTNIGYWWADRMIDDDPSDHWWWNHDYEMTVKQGWFSAVDQALSAIALLKGRCVKARVIGENKDCGNDYLWDQGEVSPDPIHDDRYNKWDHPVGWCSPPPVYHSVDSDTITRYRVVTPVIDEVYVSNLAGVFGIDPARPVHVEDVDGVLHYSMAEDGRRLAVTDIGGIEFMDVSSLWMSVDDPPNLPEDPQSVAEAFLIANDLMPSDAAFLSVGEDTQVEAYSVLEQPRPSTSVPTEEDHIIQTIVTNYQVRFVRSIDGYPISSQLSVYVGENGAIVGLKKVWKAVDPDVEDDLIPVDGAIDLFNTYGSRFSVVGGLPLDGPINVTSTGLAYYDFADGTMQDNLMPVYVFEFILDGEIERVAVPAVESFAAPIPSITNPSDGASFFSDEIVDLEGNWLFGSAPLSFEWRSDKDGVLGQAPSISTRDLSVGKHSITLRVTDAKGATRKHVISLTIVRRDVPLAAFSGWTLMIAALFICIAGRMVFRRFHGRATTQCRL